MNNLDNLIGNYVVTFLVDNKFRIHTITKITDKDNLHKICLCYESVHIDTTTYVGVMYVDLRFTYNSQVAIIDSKLLSELEEAETLKEMLTSDENSVRYALGILKVRNCIITINPYYE